jgi:hypothetical protein
VTDAKRKALRLAARGLVLVSIATQLLIIANDWWDSDPRVSCDRLPYWNEWIACLHGKSHSYVPMAEFAVGIWIVAGIAMLLGRFLPPYISGIVPASVAVVLILLMIGHWDEAVIPYAPFGQPTLWDILRFTMTSGAFAAYLVGPVAGAWLLGVYARARHRPLRVSAVV